MNVNFLQRLVVLFIVIITAYTSNAAEIWVSPEGNDLNAGTKNEPFATVNRALRKAREMRRLSQSDIEGGIKIILKDGTYYLPEPVFIRPEDSGSEISTTSIESEPFAKPVLSGGIEIAGWKPSKSINGLKPGIIWEIDVPKKVGSVLNFRQFWVNGKKALRAKNTRGSEMQRILSWDKNTESCWIPIDSEKFNFEPGMELFIQQWWAIANLRIKEVEVHQDSAKVSFENPESRIQNEHPWPAPWISEKTGNSPFFLNNALSFLDEPGEWYFDNSKSKIYYYPRAGEDLKSKAVIPFLENLVSITGTVDNPVHHIGFKNISFEYSNWLRPSLKGHVPLQAGMYLLDAYKLQTPGTPDKAGLENQAWIGRPRAAVEVNYANNTVFEACSFQHLSSTGLDYHKGAKNNTIKGNLFKDIGGSGINIGVFSDEAFETHLPYNPKDTREISSGNKITDNLITDVTNEDWGTVGISAGYVKDILIAHNEISDVSYSGISLGWGWTKSENAMRGNRVLANKIHHYGKHLYDVAGVYTLSAQPETSIEENVIYDIYKNPYAHDPYHWFYLYTDEGSSHITVKDNWVPAQKFLQNTNGPGNIWENNNAFVNDIIKQKAGIRAPYKNLLKEVVIDEQWPLKEIPQFAAVEIIGTSLDISKIKEAAQSRGFIDPKVYKWKNHVVIHGKLNYIEKFKNDLSDLFPKAELKTYQHPIYDYKKNERCSDTKMASEWDHILLTANLVEDAQLQKEYIDYHTSQFEEWPEVAEGFCNGDFQQLQIFKNGNQLMLTISIPKDAAFEKLNPLTLKNNSRMEAWNSIMSKYQTGIKGTKKSEVWVFLDPIE